LNGRKEAIDRTKAFLQPVGAKPYPSPLKRCSDAVRRFISSIDIELRPKEFRHDITLNIDRNISNQNFRHLKKG